MSEWFAILLLLFFPVIIYFIKQINPCDMLGHNWEDSGNINICKKCGLIARKVKK